MPVDSASFSASPNNSGGYEQEIAIFRVLMVCGIVCAPLVKLNRLDSIVFF